MDDGLHVSPFFGEINVDSKRTWIVYETDFENHLQWLKDLYRKKRDAMPGGFSVLWYGTECFGHHYWDDVIPLARSFQQAVAAFERDGTGALKMPDQPVTVTLERLQYGDQMALRAQGKTLLVCDGQTFAAKMNAAVGRLDAFLYSLNV